MNVPGEHNILNSLAAVTLGLEMGLSFRNISKGIQAYKGVRRRFDIKGIHNEIFVVDDYAHHPKEIDSLLGAVKSFYPNKFVVGVFQPHLFSRTRDFMDYFAESLSGFDQIFLFPFSMHK